MQPSMLIAVLHNHDHELLADDPGREAREDVGRVATALAVALGEKGFAVRTVAVSGDPVAFVGELRRLQPDLVVNLCESLAADSRGEMAVPCLLDILGLPYTGSGALALALALHKHKAKDVLRARGVPTPEARCVERLEDLAQCDLPFPVIVKPVREDASVGLDFDSVAHDEGQLARAVERVLTTLHQPALVEQYVEGREIYVPLLGNGAQRRALPLSEIRFGPAFAGRPRIVGYKAKWDAESAEYQDSPTQPAELSPELERRCVEVAQQALDALEVRDYGRVDLRVSADGQPYVIDVNPNCDLHPEAGFARAALRAGLDYPQLAQRLVETVLERAPHAPASPAPAVGAAHPAAGPDAPRAASFSRRRVHLGRGLVRARAHRQRHHAESP